MSESQGSISASAAPFRSDRSVGEESHLLPNFFIVGAARSGTTSLYYYLAEHPDVYMSYVKEPGYFGSDLTKTPNEFLVLEKGAYLDLFRYAGGKPIRGEASVYYLISKMAAQEIYEFNPNARILMILRNPVDMLYSYHSQMHLIGHEDISDFEQALAAEADRRQGRRIPNSVVVPEALYYSEVARYHSQVERFLRTFPQDQLKIVLYDDLVGKPEETYFSILDFIGVRRVAPKSYAAVNAYKRPRSTTLAAMIQRPPKVARFFLGAIPQPYRFKLLARSLVTLNSRNGTRQPLLPERKRQLTDSFADDIRKLAVLIDRDLSGWLAGSER